MRHLPGLLPADAYFAELARCRELFAGRLTIRAGVEVGDPHRFPDAAGADLAAWRTTSRSARSTGSTTSRRSGATFFRAHDADCACGGYFREALALAKADHFDVLGHLDMPKREGTEPSTGRSSADALLRGAARDPARR